MSVLPRVLTAVEALVLSNPIYPAIMMKCCITNYNNSMKHILYIHIHIYLQYTCRKKCKYKYAALFFNLLVKHTRHRCSDHVRMNWLRAERYLSHDCAVAVTYGKLAQYLLWLTSMIKLQDESMWCDAHIKVQETSLYKLWGWITSDDLI